MAQPLKIAFRVAWTMYWNMIYWHFLSRYSSNNSLLLRVSTMHRVNLTHKFTNVPLNFLPYYTAYVKKIAIWVWQAHIVHKRVARLKKKIKNKKLHMSKPLIWLILKCLTLTNFFFYHMGMTYPFNSYEWCLHVWIKFKYMVSLYICYHT